MDTGNLFNCSRCGRLFIKAGSNICPSCVKDIEEEYLTCSSYLREHKLVNIIDLSEATEVSVKQITQFIKEGRISIADFPNIGYQCESCGAPINAGKLCKKCSDRLNKDIKQVLDDYSSAKEEKKNTYFQMGDNFKKRNL